jgi:hypothetical protein
MPDFKVSTQLFSAEGERWAALGDEDSWNYSKKEKVVNG